MKKLLFTLLFLWIAKSSMGQNLFGPMLKNECLTQPDSLNCLAGEIPETAPYKINETCFLVIACNDAARILIRESSENSWKRLILPETLFQKEGFQYFTTVLSIKPAARASFFYEITILVTYSSDIEKVGYKDEKPVIKRIIIDGRYIKQYYLV